MIMKEHSAVPGVSETWDGENNWQNNGALLYRVNPVLCVLRSEQPGQLKSGLFCITSFRTRECLPCAAYTATPAHFAAGTICFQQTVPAAKSENLILSVRPSTENAGGLFHPIHPIKKKVMHYEGVFILNTAK